MKLNEGSMSLYAIGVFTLVVLLTKESTLNRMTNLKLNSDILLLERSVDHEVELLKLNVSGCYERVEKELNDFCYEIFEDGSKRIILSDE